MPHLQEGYNPIHDMQGPIKLQIELREPKWLIPCFLLRWAIFTGNIHWAAVICSVDIELPAPSRISPAFFVRWACICQYHEVILQAASKLLLAKGQQSSTSLEHVASDWRENHSSFLGCGALNLQGQQQPFWDVPAWSCIQLSIRALDCLSHWYWERCGHC